MKPIFFSPLLCCCLSMLSCEDFNRPLSGGGDFDPLRAPGSMQGASTAGVGNYNFSTGQYVTAASNSTAFFSRKPTGNADADELLAAGTSMRVVKSEGSFVKVELDNGKVGYVAAALLLETQQGAAGAVQVYPPVGAEGAIPLPTGSIPGDLQPGVAPTDLGTGAPLPPIAPPSVQELPPSSVDGKKATDSELPEPAAGSGAIPKPPLGQ